MREEEICALDIADLGRHYRSGSLSPVDVTRAALDRIRRLDGCLNAFVTVLEEPALAQVRVAEEELRRGIDRGPLHGVPVSLKDIFDTAGVRTTAASRVWRDRVPSQSATTALRLEAAGTILWANATCSSSHTALSTLTMASATTHGTPSGRPAARAAARPPRWAPE